ncbi:MAG: hypothetical protein KDD67_06185 [Ignavibacteriae bacterium]|nr:hypothetical protein [Ignavibacteriota bacterium]MCB9215297.1 hypothetical protein [Ignavibacteria bacterium]
MKNVPPTLRERIIEAWTTGSYTEIQLAEQFNVSRAYVTEVLNNHRRQTATPIHRRTLGLARELYSAVPSEVAGAFARRFEEVTHANKGLLFMPNL